MGCGGDGGGLVERAGCDAAFLVAFEVREVAGGGDECQLHRLVASMIKILSYSLMSSVLNGMPSRPPVDWRLTKKAVMNRRERKPIRADGPRLFQRD